MILLTLKTASIAQWITHLLKQPSGPKPVSAESELWKVRSPQTGMLPKLSSDVTVESDTHGELPPERHGAHEGPWAADNFSGVRTWSVRLIYQELTQV